jgi:hypothetical protein
MDILPLVSGHKRRSVTRIGIDGFEGIPSGADGPVVVQFEAERVVSTPKSNVAYSSLKTSMALSTPWKGRKRHNASIQTLCSQLERLAEGLGRGSGGFGI